MSTYLIFRGAVYREAEMVERKDISWGPDEWPSDEYVVELQLRPPMSKGEYYELKGQLDAAHEAMQDATTDEERSRIESGALAIMRKLLPIKQWLHDNNPGAQRVQQRQWYRLQAKAK